VSQMFGPNMASVKVAETRTRDEMRRADRERARAEARATRRRSRGTGWTTLGTEAAPEGTFTRWTRRRRRVVTTAG